jgi:hypothetical protein
VDIEIGLNIYSQNYYWLLDWIAHRVREMKWRQKK